MYQAPDFVKVDVSVKEVYATYGCPMDEFLQWNYTAPCPGTPEYRQVSSTYVALGRGYMCYSTNLP